MARTGRIESIVDIPKIEGELKALNTNLETVLTKVESIAVASAKIKFDGFDKAKNIKETAEANVTLNNAAMKSITISKELSEANALRVKKEKELTAAAKELERQRKAGIKTIQKQNLKEAEYEAAIRKEVKSINDLRNQTNALIAKRNALDKTTKSGKKEFDKLTASINKNNAALRASGTAADKQRMNIGNYGSALKGVGTQLMGALGVTAGLYGFVRAIGSVIKTSRDFEKQSATLAGVLDVEKSQITALTAQAVQLGGKYPTLASEVLNLQTAYARLGFSQKQIIDLTEPTIRGSFALNAELGDTAELVGAVVKSYDELSATDAGTIIDQLTKSTQKSSLNFEALKTALPKVAGAANAMNIPLNETLATLGTAIDATQDASIAGTSYRKILLSNASAGRSLADGLEIINSSTNKVKTAQELYGDRAAIVALALANQTEKTKGLADSINNSLGVAQRTAEKQMDTLGGAIDGVSSSWEKFTLTMNKSNGALQKILTSMSDAISTAADLESVGTQAQLGGFFLRLFGFGDDEIKEAQKSISNYYDGLRSMSIEELTNTYTLQAGLVERFRQEGNEAEAKAQQRRLSYIGKLIGEKTQTEITAEEEKAKKLKELLAAEEKEGIENNKKLADDAAKKAQKELETRVKLVTEKMKLAEEDQALLDGLDKEFLDGLEQELKAGEDKLKEETAILEEQLKEQSRLRDEQRDDQAEKDQEAADQRAALEQGVVDGIMQGIDSVNELYQNKLEQQIQDLETQKEYELQLVGDNEAAKDSINRKYAAKEAALKTKAAKADKSAAMIKALINTALAVTSALTVAPPAGFVLAAIAAVLGGLQVAAISSQPIPKYFKGRDGGPAEFAITGDQGAEIIDIPGQGQFLSPDQSTFTYLPQGASVIPHAETMERLATPEMGKFTSMSAMDMKMLRSEVNGLHKGFIMLADVIHNKKEYNFNITEKGMYLAVKNGESWTSYVNKNIMM